VNSADCWPVLFDITENVKLEFDKRGVSIPFPQRDVHVHQSAA
jgi:small conductance mechanosensitive channel